MTAVEQVTQWSVALGTNRLRGILYILTYGYLILPYLVFAIGWIRQPYSTLTVFLLAGGAIAGITAARRQYAHSPESRVSVKSFFLMLVPVLGITMVSGAGGWGFQDLDWIKHNSILRDLVTDPWPVVYDLENGQLALTYYIGYLLPSAYVGKLLGWEAANHALFLYTLIGFSLSVLWIRLLTEANWWWFALVFVAFSGLDVAGQAILAVYREPSLVEAVATFVGKIAALEHLGWWAGYGFAQVSSIATLMVFVPNQGIAGWLLTALIISDARAGHLRQTCVLYLALSSLWAPFVCLGLIPFVLVLVGCQWRQRRFDYEFLRETVSLPNVAGVTVGLIVAIYYAARFQTFSLSIDMSSIYEEQITLTFLRQPELFFIRYVLFIALEFAVLHGLLYVYLTLQKEPLFTALRALLCVSSVILILLPLLNWGWNNEPSMRSSIPAFFVTALVCIRVLGDPPRSLMAMWVKRAIASLLIVGSLNATVEFGRHVEGIYQRGALVSVPDVDEVDTIFEIQEERYSKMYNFIAQYVGSANSYFTRYLAKRSCATSDGFCEDASDPTVVD